MQKALTYSGFVISTLVVIAVFITATTYLQLGIAAALYPFLVYFGLKLFPRKNGGTQVIGIEVTRPVATKAEVVSAQPVEVKDIDKRAFLKMIGAAGLTFFMFSLLNRRAEGQFFSRALGPGTTNLLDVGGRKINPSEAQATDGYRISEIDDNVITFYGFVKTGGSWFIMREDTDEGTFRYTKGENNFPSSWSQRDNLNYDYYHNIFS